MYTITGKNAPEQSEFQTLDEARAAIRDQYLGQEGEWAEDTAENGDHKVVFKGKDGKTSWTIKQQEPVEA